MFSVYTSTNSFNVYPSQGKPTHPIEICTLSLSQFFTTCRRKKDDTEYSYYEVIQPLRTSPPRPIANHTIQHFFIFLTLFL